MALEALLAGMAFHVPSFAPLMDNNPRKVTPELLRDVYREIM